MGAGAQWNYLRGKPILSSFCIGIRLINKSGLQEIGKDIYLADISASREVRKLALHS
jgi:hypothetical protein